MIFDLFLFCFLCTKKKKKKMTEEFQEWRYTHGGQYGNTATVITLTVETGVRLKSSLVKIRTDILSHLTFVKPLDLFLNLSPLRLFCPSVHMKGHNNASFHNLIWQRCPKTGYDGRS